MKTGRWLLTVRDARGREYEGIVTYGDRVPAARSSIGDGMAFRIALIARPRTIVEAPEQTAICVPGAPQIRAVGRRAPHELPSRIEQLTLAPQEMRAFAAGTIVMTPPGIVDPSDIFPVHSEHPRLDRLARALVEVAEAEAVAAYLAVIRHELKLPPGDDALAAVEQRLAPQDRATRPPARAPAVARLKSAAKELRKGFAPDGSLEQLVDDLQFIAMFGDSAEPLSADALSRLLDDVLDVPPKQPRARKSAKQDEPARVIPFPPRKDE